MIFCSFETRLKNWSLTISIGSKKLKYILILYDTFWFFGEINKCWLKLFMKGEISRIEINNEPNIYNKSFSE
jgi:hypothetical protein